MPTEKPTAIVYVDGLNLFYRKLSKRNELKWLNILDLAERLLPNQQVREVKYFSAPVKRLDGKTESQIRQRIYLNALGSLNPRVSVTLGQMRIDSRVYPKSPKSFDDNGELMKTRVFKYEEKGTDVSIATEISLDMASKLVDQFVLFSSDGDFKPLVRRLKERLNCDLVVFDPKSFTDEILEKSQFPNQISPTLSRPRHWLN
jgi:hypothetical protein